MTPHKHHDLIVAWAKGATIQIELSPGYWTDCSNNQPGWWTAFQYRIKPKTDIIKYKYINPEGSTFSRRSMDDRDSGGSFGLPNLKLTLDGETDKLKKAEVINEE